MSIRESMDKEITWGQAVLIFALVFLIVVVAPSMALEFFE